MPACNFRTAPPVPCLPPCAAYYPQYAEISKTKDASGFSSAVSGILIIANSIRIIFYLLEPFDVVLLVQSIVVIIGQGALLQLCITHTQHPKPHRHFDITSPFTHWWAWSTFPSYVYAWLSIVAVCGAVAALGRDSPLVVQGVGTAALGIEASMTLPQLVQNAQRGSTAGLSAMLVASWVVGDFVKMGTYLTSGAPWQFMACATVQLLTDSAILGQVFFLRQPPPPAAPPQPDSAE